MTRASRRKYHIIYKTTCMINGNFYIGMHSTDNLNDGYLGSGTRLRRSIAKHGAEQHCVEVLEHLHDRTSLAKRETELVNEQLLLNKRCMNLIPGGTGFADRPATKAETLAKMSASQKKNNADPVWKQQRWATHRALMNRPKVRASFAAAQQLHQNRDEVKAQRSRPCTVDDTTIFPSIKALQQALGRGRSGSRSPNFKIIEPDGTRRNVLGVISAWADPIKKAERLQKRRHTLLQKQSLQQGA